MNEVDKNKFKHDFSNSIVIINSLSRSASSIIEKISLTSINETNLSEKQVELFKRSMDAIQNEANKIKTLVENVIKEL